MVDLPYIRNRIQECRLREFDRTSKHHVNGYTLVPTLLLQYIDDLITEYEQIKVGAEINKGE